MSWSAIRFSAAVAGKISQLRTHCYFGRAKIAMYLQRYPRRGDQYPGMWRILKRPGMNRLPASQRFRLLLSKAFRALNPATFC